MAGSMEFVKEEMIEDLIGSFGEVLDVDIIMMVAEQLDYNVHKTTLQLLKLHEDQRQPAIRNKSFRIRNQETYESTEVVEEVFQDLSLGIKVLILMRGLPGSGKTYLADSILEAALESPVRSDHISSTKKNLENQMIRGCTPVIVDEVNLQIWDMEPYAHIAVKYGYRIHILEMTTKWSNNLKKLEKKTKDDISKEELKRMRDIFIKDITPEYLLVECGLTLRYQLELKNNSTKGGRKSMTSDRIKRLDASFALKFQNSSVDENKEKTFDRKNENYLLNEKYLFDTFPHVDENVIVELLHSNDFDYDRTEEDLLVAFENEETLNNVSGSLEATGSKKKNNNRRRRRRKNK